MTSDDDTDGIHIPLDQLSPETLRRLVEEFVSREGTEYGAGEVELSTKVEQVIRQLRRGEAAIAFDPRMQSTTIVSVDRRSR